MVFIYYSQERDLVMVLCEESDSTLMSKVMQELKKDQKIYEK